MSILVIIIKREEEIENAKSLIVNIISMLRIMEWWNGFVFPDEVCLFGLK